MRQRRVLWEMSCWLLRCNTACEDTSAGAKSNVPSAGSHIEVRHATRTQHTPPGMTRAHRVVTSGNAARLALRNVGNRGPNNRGPRTAGPAIAARDLAALSLLAAARAIVPDNVRREGARTVPGTGHTALGAVTTLAALGATSRASTRTSTNTARGRSAPFLSESPRNWRGLNKSLTHSMHKQYGQW